MKAKSGASSEALLGATPEGDDDLLKLSEV